MEKKILNEQDIKVGMKVCHTWLTCFIYVVPDNKPDISREEIHFTAAQREAKDGYIYIGEPGKPFLKL
jgi:hypothetical protein